MINTNSSAAVRRTVWRLSWVWLLAGIAVGAAWLWPSRELGGGSAPRVTRTEFASLDSFDSRSFRVTTRNIEDIRVGDRVLAENPEVSDFERLLWNDPDPTDLRRLKLTMAKPDGGELEIEMLRPADWLEEKGVAAGQTFYLDLPEMGAQGMAYVVSVAPCPRFQPGAGQIVTATFAHPPATEVLEVHFQGEKAPIGVTNNHLFWSEDRDDFVAIGEMSIGEAVRTYSGDSRCITAKLPLPRPERVYNLEVYGEHVYFVGDLGLLAHNEYLKEIFKKAGVNNFDDFWNKTSHQKLQAILADPHSKEVLESAARRLRRGGGDHEWYMVTNLLKMKEWKVSADQLRQMQQSIKELNKNFKSLAAGGSGFRHGGSPGSSFHQQLDSMVNASSSLRDFAIRLRAFANKELKNGVSDLPSLFHDLKNFK